MPAGKSKNGIRNNINARAARGKDAKMVRLSELMLQRPYERQAWYAEQLGISKPVVCRLIPQIYQLWREEKLKNVDQLVIDELNRLDWVEKEAQDGWEKSKKLKEVVTKEQTKTKGWEGAAKIRITTEQPAGDAKFLETILKCREARRKLLGLDAPFKIDATIEIQKEREQTADAFIRILTSSIQLDDIAIEELVKKLDRWADTGELPPAPQLPPMIEASPLQKETDGQS